jgi:hypothetical protein
MITSCRGDCDQGDCQALSLREAVEFWGVVCTPLALVLLWWVFS